MGINELRLFDIDGIQDYEFVEELLVDLGFPEKYTWVVQSGSGEGFHIYFLCKYKEEVFQKLGGEKAVYKFKLKKDGLCKHIELRWKDCQTALPPSMHESSGMYSFYYKEPLEVPKYIAAEKVVDCLLKHCEISNQKSNVKSKKGTQELLNERKKYFDREKLESALKYISQHLTEGSYEEWYRIGFALVPLGEEGENYFVKMSMDNPNYAETEDSLRKKFDELIRDYDGRVSLGTIYHIAELYGWKKPVIKFWQVEKNGSVKIVRTRFKRFLESEGFCKYKLDPQKGAGTNYLFIRDSNNIVEEIDIIGTKDFVLDYLYSLPIDEFEDTSRSEVIDALIKSTNQFFAHQFLEFLITRNIQFNRDSSNSSFIYFENGFTEVKQDSIEYNEYKNLKRKIWKKQIIEGSYTITKTRSDFEEFLFNVCRRNIQRFTALKSAIGFMLHSYKDPTRAKAIVLIDERLSEGAFGRSGKGLVIQAISKIRNVITEDGRNFSPSKNFAFQRISVDTDVIAFEDLKEKFPFEKLYSIITEGITVEKKNKDEIFVAFGESPKIIISSNFSISGVDDSTVDRQFIIEVSDHYNMKHRPVHEFGKMFFDGWSNEEWNEFYNLMIECLQHYLKYAEKTR